MLLASTARLLPLSASRLIILFTIMGVRLTPKAKPNVNSHTARSNNSFCRGVEEVLLEIPRDEVQNYHSALMNRAKKEGLGDAINFSMRNVEREKVKTEKGTEYYKIVEGDLYFEK